MRPIFSSDHHHAHKRICEYSNRPWSQDDNSEMLIQRWNERVGIDQDVYHLGDFAFIWPKKIGQLFEIIEQLNGHIHFIKGNHCDPKVWQLVEDKNFAHVEWVKDYHEMQVEGQPIVLSHYPMETWRSAAHGSWMLHGHCHGFLPPRGKRLDVGIDNHPEFRMFTYEEVIEHMAKQQIAIVDHHKGER